MRISTAAKAYVGMAVAVAGAIAATFPDSAVGKVAIVVGAGLSALAAIYRTKNTQVVNTGPGEGPVVVGEVVADSGAKVGEVIADTGAAVGGVVAGTTGRVGSILDATVGKLLPGKGAAA